MDLKPWRQELEQPTEAFFPVLGAVLRETQGALQATREAVEGLVPRIDWAAYQPHIPHGLLGLWAVFRLEPLLEGTSFRRLLATQLHAFAHEARSPRGRKLPTFGQGSGHWGNLGMAIETHRPSIAWGEAVGVQTPGPDDFLRIARLVSSDMACVGHKSVMALRLGELNEILGAAPVTGRRLLGISAWLAAAEPCDTFWFKRIRQRLEAGAGFLAEAAADLEAPVRLSRIICEAGLVELLNTVAASLREDLSRADLETALVLAAASKQADARRDLEGKTAWNFVYLAALNGYAQGPEPWIQAAALINLFPSEEETSRLKPRPPRQASPDPGPASVHTHQALLEAVLDGEAPEAMHLALQLIQGGEAAGVLRILAEAAALNDPAFNHSHQILAVASIAELLPRGPEGLASIVLPSLAKLLANGQGSCELGRRAEAELG